MRTLCLLLFASTIFISAANPLAADAACENECWAEWDYCCANCGSYWCWDDCDQRRDQCLSYCATCPRTREWTTTTFYSDTAGPLPLVCLSNQNYYRKYTRTYKNVQYREITNCNGTVTTTVLGANYTTKTCWKLWSPGPCIPNSDYPPIENLCIIK
jgi:hypothetical protein